MKRALGKECIVLCDGMNYIKGFRYQLYCEAKAVQTGSCVVCAATRFGQRGRCLWGDKRDEDVGAGRLVPGILKNKLTAPEVHVGTPISTCRETNTRLFNDPHSGGGYSEAVFENLVFRYEEPNGMARWDSPLFTVPYDDETPPFDAIWEAMVGSDGTVKVVKPNMATVLVCCSCHYLVADPSNRHSLETPASESDYLYELDKTTQELLQTILDWQKDHLGESGGEIALANGDTIELPAAPMSLPQLQRLRRQYISLNRQHQLAQNRIRANFVVYLNNSFQ